MTTAAVTEPREIDLDQIVSDLRTVRLNWREASGRAREPAGRELPSPDTISHVVDDLCGVLFPLRLGPPELRPQEEDAYVKRTLTQTLAFLQGQVRLELAHEARLKGLDPDVHGQAQQIAHQLAAALPEIRRLLDADVSATFRSPARHRSVDELMLCSPGVRAMIHHRLAHQLHVAGAPLVALMVADLAHTRTGMDIHPGAHIGPGLAIAHGTGVVIGEGVRIGRNVRLHQAVTLDADDSALTAAESARRYPTVGDDVVIHAGATVLGALHIGSGARIGGHAWLTDHVPAAAQVEPAITRR